MKKLLCLVMIIMTVLAVHVSAYADTALSFETQVLPDASANVPYSTQIVVSGGAQPHKFQAVDEWFYPTGITLTEDGVLSGTPLVGGVTYCNVGVIVTDANGDRIRKTFSLNVLADKVDFKIVENTFEYDGNPHSVTAVPYVDGEDASAYVTDFEITYSGATSQTEVGNYPIKIKVNTPGYIYGSMDKTRMYIEQNTLASISFGSTSFVYDGTPKTPSISVTGRYTASSDVINLEHTVLYEGISGTSYSSSTPPTLPGNYRVSCNITDTNFATPSANSTTFEITANTVNFRLDNMAPFYYGDTWNRAYKPLESSVKEGDYTVKYVKDGAEYDAPSALGVYSVKITLNEGSLYTVGEISPATVTVEEKPVNFTVENYLQKYTGGELYPTITNDCGLIETTDDTEGDYTVEYYKDESKTTPMDVGEYTIVITVSKEGYTFGSQSASVFTIYEADNKTEFILGDGNSIFAKINAAGGDIESAKQGFLSTYTYNEKSYSPNAWGAVNLDADEKALFIYNGEKVTLPTVSAIDSEGNEASVTTVLETANGEIDLTGATEYTPNLPCGVYTIRYSIQGDTSENPVIATRNVVILWPLGDVNFDKNVNSIDGNYIMGNLDMAETTADEKLFKYRLCDINKDGVVNSGDRDAIYNRIINPITEYYK